MKKINTCLALLVICLVAKAQNPYYDALILTKYIKDKSFTYGFDLAAEVTLKKEKNKLSTDTEKLIADTLAIKVRILNLNSAINREANRERKNALANNLISERKKIAELNKLFKENIIRNQKIDFLLDSMRLAKKDTLFSILKKYNVISLPLESINTTTTQTLQTEIDKNPFFEGYDIAGVTRSTNRSPSGLRSTLSSIGGLNVTNIANAVADLMIERAKEELTVAFFDRFKEFAKKNPEFEILFPKTTSNLANLLGYKYPEMLEALRTGFIDDLRQITLRLDDVLALPRYIEFFKNLPEVKIAIRSLRLVHELETGASNAADVISELAHYAEWQNPKLENAGNILKTVALISESIRDTVTQETDKRKASVWVSAKELKKTFLDPNNQTVATIYLGLLYQRAQMENIKYKSATGTDIRLDSILASFKNDVPTFYDKLGEFIVLSEKVNANFRELKNKIDNKQTISDEDYYTYIQTSLDVVEYGFSLAKLFGADVTKAENYLSILNESNDLYKNIYSKEYNQAIVNAVDILTKIKQLTNDAKVNVNDASDLVASKAPKAMKLTNSQVLHKENNSYYLTNENESTKIKSFDELDIFIDETTFVSSTKKLQRPLEKLTEFLEKIKPYALFIANVAEAKNEADIKNALDAVILPVGSSSIKKRSIYNISVQSYLGARWNTADNNTNSAWNNKWGVTAPIGFAFSLGTKGENPASWSLFASLIDIGAIVDYKLTVDANNNVNQDYEIKLEQIFAPGGYIVYGVPWSLPVAVGLGGQYGPGIYHSNNTINQIQPGWRWNAFIAVDIPFFNISNRVRTK